MTDLPILFTGPMVRAIPSGRKTMTRRVVKWPKWIADHETGAWWLNHHPCVGLHKDGRVVKQFCNPYQVGRHLWVRETWWANQDRDVAYRADGEMPEHMAGTRWRPSIYMPRWASRITLEVTASRVERLQEISDEDCWSEGISEDEWDEAEHYQLDGSPLRAGSPERCTFASLWDTIYAKRGHPWEANDDVFAVTFKRIAERQLP